MALDDLTGKNIQDTYQRVVQTDGTNLADGTGSLLPISIDGNDVTISGSLIANEYIVSSSVTNITVATLSGSTEFGDDVEDTHKFTGSLFVSGNLTFGSTSNNRKGIYFQDTGTKILGDTNFLTIDGDNQIDLIADNNIFLTAGTGKVEVQIGNLEVANGFISASGDLYGSNIYHTGKIYADGDQVLYYDDNNDLNITAGRSIKLGSQATTHVTASGNISASASSIVQAGSGSFHHLVGDTTKETGLSISGYIEATNITASNVSASTTINSTTYNILGTQILAQVSDLGGTTTLFIGNTSNKTEIEGTHIKLDAPVTASGNISASGDIHASNFILPADGTIAPSTNNQTIKFTTKPPGAVENGEMLTVGPDLIEAKGSSGNVALSSMLKLASPDGGQREVVFNDGSNDIDFAIRSSNQVAFKVDASNDMMAFRDYVGIGTSANKWPTDNYQLNGTPTYQLMVMGKTNLTGSVEIEGPLTASGDISASGTITTDTLTSNNIVFTPGATSIKIEAPDETSGNLDGAALTIESGDGFGSNQNGGDITIQTGKGSGAGDGGNLTINTGGGIPSGSISLNSPQISINGNITASNDISASGRFIGNNITLGDTAVTTPSYDFHIRNNGASEIAIESFANNNATINFLTNQSNASGEPDFTIGQYHTDGGFQIRSDHKTFFIVGANDGDEIKVSGSLNVTNDITASGDISASGNIKLNYIETAKIPMIQYTSTDVTSVNQGRVLAASSHDNATDSFALEWDTSLFEDTDFFETGNPTAKTGSNATTFAVKQTGRYEISCGVAFRTLSGARPGLNLGIFTSSKVSSVGALRAPGVGSHGYSRFSGAQMGTSANIANFVIQLTSGSAISMKIDYKEDWGGVSNTVWSGSLSYFNMKKIG